MRRTLIALGCLALASHGTAQQAEPIYRTLHTVDHWISSVRASPDGRFILYASDAYQRNWSVFDRRTQSSTPIDLEGAEAAWSPRGDWIAYANGAENGGGRRIYARPVNPGTGQPSGPPRRISLSAGQEPQFSPDGNSIAFISAAPAQKQFRLMVVPASGGRERTVHLSDVPLVSPRWSRDGQWFFYTRAPAQGDWEVFRIRAEGGAPTRAAAGNSDLGVSADGRYLAQYPRGVDQGTLIIRDASDGREVARRQMPARAPAA